MLHFLSDEGSSNSHQIDESICLCVFECTFQTHVFSHVIRYEEYYFEFAIEIDILFYNISFQITISTRQRNMYKYISFILKCLLHYGDWHYSSCKVICLLLIRKSIVERNFIDKNSYNILVWLEKKKTEKNAEHFSCQWSIIHRHKHCHQNH